MRKIRVTDLTWPEFDELVGHTPIILPIGATEQHGHHLPLGSDAMHVVAVAEGAAEKVEAGALVAPVLSYGYKSNPRTGGGENFPGTVSLDASTLIRTVQDVLRQFIADGAKRIVVLSGHYENSVPMHEGIDLCLREQGTDTDVKIVSLLWTDLISEQTLARIYPGEWPGIELEHAAWFETSILMHLRPDLVHLERATTEIAEFPPYDVHPPRPGFVPASGSLTRSQGAAAEFGKIILDEATSNLARVIADAF